MTVPKLDSNAIFALNKNCIYLDTCENPDTTLRCTKWRLVGIFDANTDTLIKELLPKNLNNCYTLKFYTDTSFVAISVSNMMWMNILKPHTFWTTFVGESKDGEMYSDALQFTTAYTYNRNELKMFFDNNKYLLFKPFSP